MLSNYAHQSNERKLESIGLELLHKLKLAEMQNLRAEEEIELLNELAREVKRDWGIG